MSETFSFVSLKVRSQMKSLALIVHILGFSELNESLAVYVAVLGL